MGRKRKRIWKTVVCILDCLEGEKSYSKDRKLDLQKLKNIFFYNLWSWDMLYVGELFPP